MKNKTFLLTTEPELWRKFTSKIPRQKSINDQINELLDGFTNDN